MLGLFATDDEEGGGGGGGRGSSGMEISGQSPFPSLPKQARIRSSIANISSFIALISALSKLAAASSPHAAKNIGIAVNTRMVK